MGTQRNSQTLKLIPPAPISRQTCQNQSRRLYKPLPRQLLCAMTCRRMCDLVCDDCCNLMVIGCQFKKSPIQINRSARIGEGPDGFGIDDLQSVWNRLLRAEERQSCSDGLDERVDHPASHQWQFL